jgi:hypothetical protein
MKRSSTSGYVQLAQYQSLIPVLTLDQQQGNVLRMQIAHRKTQTDHKMLSDRTDALAARVDAVQADLRGALRYDDEVETLRTRVKVAEDLLSELQGRLSSSEAALAEANAQAEAQAQAAERAAAQVVKETEVSPCTHAPSALGAHSTQSDTAPPAIVTTTITPPITPTRKRKRTEDDGDGDVDDGDGNVVRVSEEEQGNSVVVRAHCPKVQARKRPRRFVRAAIQVTAAATIGAVAAWSALAFV